MSSILTNASALTALQSLAMTQKSLASVQQEVSTGLRVSSAADNSSYWAISQQLTANSAVVGAANDALAGSQAAISTANSAISSVIATIKTIQTTLTQATAPGADIGNINTTLASLGKQLTDAVNGASFNGLNLLDGSTGALNFVSGFNATATGGTFNSISLTTQALTGTGGVTSTTTAPNVTDTATIAALQALADNTGTVTTPSYGVSVIDKTTDTTGDTFSIASVALDGTATTTTYAGLDANGNTTTAATAVSFAVSISTTPPGGLLTQGGTDLTNMTTTAATAGAQLNKVETALAAVTTYGAVLGATQDRMTSQSTFNAALTTSYANGVSALVDADMNQASTRLQALQTQQQLGIQSLSIANQSSQLILKLFQS